MTRLNHLDRLRQFEKNKLPTGLASCTWLFNVAREDLDRQDVQELVSERGPRLALGDPQPSYALTAEELEKMGVLGLYHAAPIVMDGLEKAFTLPPEITEIHTVVGSICERAWSLTQPVEPQAAAPTQEPPATPLNLDSHLL